MASWFTTLSLRAWRRRCRGFTLGGDDAVRLGVLELVEQVGGVEQGLGRDAAAVQAGAAEEGILLDDGGLETELAGADGGDVAAGTGAENRDVEDFVLSQGPTPRERDDGTPRGMRAGHAMAAGGAGSPDGPWKGAARGCGMDFRQGRRRGQARRHLRVPGR